MNTPPTPKACRWLSWLVPASIRQHVFEPAYNDALADYVASGQSPTRFLVATAWLVMLSWGAVIGSKMTVALAKLVPAALREWWRMVR